MTQSKETYKGVAITLSTLQRVDGEWTSNAEVHVPGEQILTLSDGRGYASEQDAKQAALSLAAQAIDGHRTRKGKL